MFNSAEEMTVLGVAVLLDLTLGEPPTWAHPTVWMGQHIKFVERWSPKHGLLGLAAGLSIALTLPSIWGGELFFLSLWLKSFHPIVYILAGGALLKTTFSVRLLQREAALVQGHLERSEMEQVRARMPSLVSRDPSNLSAGQAAAATVESVSENISDSILGPWLAFALFGLPGAFAYRMINTLDSMIGYHGVYEHVGKASARLDDLINLIPARLAGLLLVAASAFLPGQRLAGAWRIMWRDHGRTQSPNAGWTMSGMAGALGVQLEKVDPDVGYQLGNPDRPIEPEDIGRAVQSMYLVAIFGLAIALVVAYIRGIII